MIAPAQVHNTVTKFANSTSQSSILFLMEAWTTYYQ